MYIYRPIIESIHKTHIYIYHKTVPNSKLTDLFIHKILIYQPLPKIDKPIALLIGSSVWVGLNHDQVEYRDLGAIIIQEA